VRKFTVASWALKALPEWMGSRALSKVLEYHKEYRAFAKEVGNRAWVGKTYAKTCLGRRCRRERHIHLIPQSLIKLHFVFVCAFH
jgi:hypothetical protein